ncbi:hypothetical protein ACVIM8_003993 [Bradyrhizobium sp. USDA 4529]
MRYRCIYSSLPAFRPSAKLVPPTMPSADFCTAVKSPYDDLSLVAETQRRSPEVRSTAFAARPPDLPPRPLMTVDFAITCSLVRPGRPRYPVFVHRAAALLHASFRPHLAMTPLRFANPSPSSGWIEDFHLQAAGHARHTRKRPPGFPSGPSCLTVASHLRAISGRLYRGPISRPHPTRRPLHIGTVAIWSPIRRDGFPSP